MWESKLQEMKEKLTLFHSQLAPGLSNQKGKNNGKKRKGKKIDKAVHLDGLSDYAAEITFEFFLKVKF